MRKPKTSKQKKQPKRLSKKSASKEAESLPVSHVSPSTAEQETSMSSVTVVAEHSTASTDQDL